MPPVPQRYTSIWHQLHKSRVGRIQTTLVQKQHAIVLLKLFKQLIDQRFKWRRIYRLGRMDFHQEHTHRQQDVSETQSSCQNNYTFSTGLDKQQLQSMLFFHKIGSICHCLVKKVSEYCKTVLLTVQCTDRKLKCHTYYIFM